MDNKSATVYPAGFFEEEEAQKLAENTNIPLQVARALINAEDDEFDNIDEKIILAKRIERAIFAMRFLEELSLINPQ